MNEDEVNALLVGEPIGLGRTKERPNSAGRGSKPGSRQSRRSSRNGTDSSAPPTGRDTLDDGNTDFSLDLPPAPTTEMMLANSQSMLDVHPLWEELRPCYESFRQTRDTIVLQCLVTAKYVQQMLADTAGVYNELRLQQQFHFRTKTSTRRRMGTTTASLKSTQSLKKEPAQEIELLELPPLRIGFIGCGKIGHVIVEELLETGFINPSSISVSTRRPELHKQLADCGVDVYYDNDRLVRESMLVFLCCQPTQIQCVAQSVKVSLRRIEEEKSSNISTLTMNLSNSGTVQTLESSNSPGDMLSSSATRDRSKKGDIFHHNRLVMPPFFLSILSTASLAKLRNLLGTQAVHRTHVKPAHLQKDTSNTDYSGSVQENEAALFAEAVCRAVQDLLQAIPQMEKLTNDIRISCLSCVSQIQRDLLSGNHEMYKVQKELTPAEKAARFLRQTVR